MYSLIARTIKQAVAHHKALPARNYTTDVVQADRVARSQKAVESILRRFDEDRLVKIVELGCGTGDITGPFSTAHEVVGYECSDTAVDLCSQRFPQMRLRTQHIESVAPHSSDILVMCEFLEHLSDPVKIATQWLQLAEYSVISHPLDEPVGSQLSGGDHQWGFTEDDAREWFKMGKHRLLDLERFQMGLYTVVLARGKHK